MGDKNVGTLEDQARKRRERLMAMRKRAAGEDLTQGDSKIQKDENGDKTEIKLRNYVPLNEGLEATSLPVPKPVHIEDEVKEQLEASKPTLTIKDEVDLLNLAPRKPDWDLKRDIKGKLEKLERRTQRAIAELIRDRLKEADGSQLAEVVAGPQPQQTDMD